MSAHCSCPDSEKEPVTKEVSPSHAEFDSYITECANCWGLIRA